MPMRDFPEVVAILEPRQWGLEVEFKGYAVPVGAAGPSVSSIEQRWSLEHLVGPRVGKGVRAS